MNEIDIPVAPAKIATSFLQGKKIAQELGFPLVIRPSFTLGGSGASFVHTKQEFEDLLSKGLHASPIHEVLIDKAVVGWKEYELELLRDDNDNVIIICIIENLDPMGIHTGDSITIAPSMTLSDSAYQRMRTMAIKMMRSIGNLLVVVMFNLLSVLMKKKILLLLKLIQEYLDLQLLLLKPLDIRLQKLLQN